MKKKIYLLFIFLIALVGCDQSGTNEIESLDLSSKDLEQNTTESKIIQNFTGEIGDCKFSTYPFKAGRNSMDAGEVVISYDETYVYVKVTSTAGFQGSSENVKMWIGKDLNDLPSAGNGAPINGHFPYKANVSGDTHVFQIALADIDGGLGCEDLIYIVVHGDVMVVNDGKTTAETAYAGDHEGEGNRWWWYMEESVECCDEDSAECCDDDSSECCDEEQCYDVFAYTNSDSSKSFCYESDGNYLGWVNQFKYINPGNGPFKFPLYANVDDCDPSSGTDMEIGYAEILFSSDGEVDFVSIKYVLNKGYEFTSASLRLSKCSESGYVDCSDQKEIEGSLINEKSVATFGIQEWLGGYDLWDGYIYPSAKVCKK